MSGISDFRAQHPEYNDMSDQQLADALYSKFYSDMPRAQFDAKMGISAQAAQPSQTSESLGLYQGVSKVLDNAATGVRALANTIPIPFTGHADQNGRYTEMRLGDAVDEAAKLLGFPSADDAKAAHQAYIASQQQKGIVPGKIGEIGGEILATLPAAAELGPMAAGALAGALSTDSNTPLGVVEDTGLGAIGGKVGDTLIRGASKVISPVISGAVQKLTSEGIPLTIGQRLGGLAKSVEDKLTGFAGIGDQISARRAEGVAGLNKAVANRILGKVGEKLPPDVEPGHELTDYVATTLGDKYDALLPQMTGKLDGDFLNAVDGIKSAARDSTLPDAQMARLNDLIKTQILDKSYQAGGELDGQTLKGIQEQLGDLASGLKSDPGYDNRTLGGYVSKLRDAVNGMLERSNPDLAPKLRKINSAYADYVKLRAAQKSVTGDQGFTPKQLQTAIRQSDRSAGKGAFARGKSSMQDLADAASEVLPSRSGDSGTAGRNALFNPLEWPAAAAGYVSGHALYSPASQRVLNALISRESSAKANAIAELLRRYGRVPAVDLNALALSGAAPTITQVSDR